MWTMKESFWTTNTWIDAGIVFKSVQTDFPVGESAAIVNVKEENNSFIFHDIEHTEFTSPPSCQCERALVHYCQLHCWTWPSLACEELSKQLKFPGRIVLSQVLSKGESWFVAFNASAVTWNNEEKDGGAAVTLHNVFCSFTKNKGCIDYIRVYCQSSNLLKQESGRKCLML